MDEYELQLLNETEMALQVTDGEVVAWLPKSQIDETRRSCPNQQKITVNLRLEPTMIILDIPDWLATDKGLC